MINKTKQKVCHILAGEIRFKQVKTDKKYDILLSWNTKGSGESPPHQAIQEK